MIHFLTGLWKALTYDPVFAAERRRAEIMARAEAARLRHDDRDYGRALMELRQATTDALRAAR
jgi:urease accessory protein UreF